MIIESLYTPDSKFLNHTALLFTCSQLHTLASPIFWENYQFECVPLKPCRDLPDDFKETDENGTGTGEILRVQWALDGDSYSPLMCEKKWVRALRLGMGELFNIIDEPELPTSAPMSDDSDIPSPASTVDTPGCFTEDQDIFHPRSLSERGRDTAAWWTRKNRFARFLRSIGPEKTATIRHLKVLYGWDAECWAGHLMDPGPMAVTIAGVLVERWMPGLRTLSVRKRSDQMLNRRGKMSQIDEGGFDESCSIWGRVVGRPEHVSSREPSRKDDGDEDAEDEDEDEDVSEDLGDEDSSDEDFDEDDERSEMTMAFDSAWKGWIRLE